MNQAFLLVAVAGLIVANGVFVAAEFALVTVRRPVIEERAAAGQRRAAAVRRELNDVSFALSSAQFGITVTSLLVGYLADRAVGEVLLQPVLALLNLPESWSLALALAGALLLSTSVQVVLGELVPKQIALAHPLGVSLALTPVTRAFGRLLRPVISVFDVAAATLARRMFAVEALDELEAGHSREELAQIIEASGSHGSLTDNQAGLLKRAIALGDRQVSEVMVPRPDVVWIDAVATVAELQDLARTTGHSRFPVNTEHDTTIVGTIHIKDVLAVPAVERADTTIQAMTTPAMIVPETASLHALLTMLRRDGRTFAVVIDEHGSTAGIVTMEDLVEELVGEIADEFDHDVVPVRRAGQGRFLVDGAMPLGRVTEECGVQMPDGDYTTIAGFALDQLGRIPAVGDEVHDDGWSLIVTAMDDLRITQLLVVRRRPPS